MLYALFFSYLALLVDGSGEKKHVGENRTLLQNTKILRQSVIPCASTNTCNCITHRKLKDSKEKH